MITPVGGGIGAVPGPRTISPTFLSTGTYSPRAFFNSVAEITTTIGIYMCHIFFNVGCLLICSVLLQSSLHAHDGESVWVHTMISNELEALAELHDELEALAELHMLIANQIVRLTISSLISSSSLPSAEQERDKASTRVTRKNTFIFSSYNHSMFQCEDSEDV